MHHHNFTNLLILFSAIGLIAFLFISSTTQFKGGIFASLYPKPASFASSDSTSLPDYCSACSADLNKNGSVDQSDWNTVNACVGKNVFGTSCLNSDLNKDAKIDYKDLNCLNMTMNTSCTKTP